MLSFGGPLYPFLGWVKQEADLLWLFISVVSGRPRHSRVERFNPYDLALRDEASLSDRRLRSQHIVDRLRSLVLTRSRHNIDRFHRSDRQSESIQVSIVVNLATSRHMVDSRLKFFCESRLVEKSMLLVGASLRLLLLLVFGRSVRIIQIDWYNLLLYLVLELVSALILLSPLLVKAVLRIVLTWSGFGQ